jgi:hypothetical protein
MKKITNLLMIVCLALFSWQGYAQNSTCATAALLQIDANCGGTTTGGANSGDPTGNDDTDGNVCSSNYSNGDDYIFEYTATTEGQLNLSLWATNSWTGLMVTDGCPTTGTCFASSTSGAANEALTTPAMTIGTTYYIQISTYANPQSAGQFCLDAELIVPPPPPTCGDIVYDTGGAASNYSNNENYTITYSPNMAGDLVTLDFTAVAIESGWDFLSIYDGADTSAPALEANLLAPASFTATNPAGQLTIMFTSDGSFTLAGWVANYTCAAPPPCLEVSGLTETNVNATATDITFTDNNATTPVGGWDYELLDITAGETAGTGTPGNVTTTTINLTGLTGGGNSYEIIVIADCDGAGTVSGPASIAWTQGNLPGSTCDAAITVTPGVFPDSQINNSEGSASNAGGTGATDAIWFSYTTPAGGGTITVTSGIDPDLPDTRLSIHSGACGALVLEGFNDDIGSPNFASTIADLPVVGGTEYLIEWDDRWGTAAFDWSLEFVPTPTCFAPTDVVVSNFGLGTAQVDFTDTNPAAVNDYDYELVNLTLGEVATGTANGNATTNPFTLTGLLENNGYEIYVKAVCLPGDESLFSAPVSFTLVLNAPGCATNFSPADLTTDVSRSATFSWNAPTAGGTASAYTFFFGTDPAALTNIGTVQGTSASLSNLSLGTTYFWQIVPGNVVGLATLCVVNSFTTINLPSGPAGITCGAGDESTSQFTEAFDSQGAWTGDIGAGDGSWLFGETGGTTSGSTGPSAGQDGAYMYYEASGSTTLTASAVSPLIDLNAIDAGDQAELTFYMHAYGSGMGTLIVGAAATPAGPFTQIFTWTGQIQTTTGEDWLQVGVDVTAYTGGDLYLEFSHTGTGDFRGDMSIDTLEVNACDVIPSCQIPNMLAVSGVTGGDATITWNDPNPITSTFEYELLDITAGDVADESVDGAPATATANLTGLTFGNDYRFLVRSVCPDGIGGFLRSNWSAGLNWNQTELPGCASSPTPANAATGIAPGVVTHTWTAPSTGGTVVDYDFYFGTDPLALNLLVSPTTESQGISGISGNTTYYWQVVPTNLGGDATGCPIWSYTTAPLDAGGVDCASATVVTDGTYTSQVNNANPGGGGGGTPDDFLWFEYTTTTGGSLNIDSCGGGSDTTLAVFDACGGTVVASSGDDCATGSGNNYASQVTFDVLANETYYIQWDDTWDAGVFAWNVNLTPTCSGLTTTWDGSFWDNGAPGADDYAIIDGNYATGLTGSIIACSIQVNGSRALFVNADTAITSGSDINVLAGAVVAVAHTGSVVQVDDAAVVNNNGSINVFVDTPILEVYDFMLLGSPMSMETRADVFTDALIVRNHLTENFSPNAAVAATSPGAGNWLDEEGDDWPVHTGAINPGEGYFVVRAITGGPRALNLDYNTGTLNNGIVTYTAGYNMTGGTPADDQNASPNVVANPYASAISAVDFINGNANVDAVYFWEHVTAIGAGAPGPYGLNYTMEDISIYNLTGGTASGSDPTTTPNEFISTAQGFGVKVTSMGDITFNNSMRRAAGNTTLRNQDLDRIWLNVQSGGYDLNSNALIGFMEEATNAIDIGYDTKRLATNVSLYSHLVDGSDQLGIQARSAFDENVRIPMGFATLIDETIEYKISIQNMEGLNLGDKTAYLVDNQLNTVTNLNETNYTFVSSKGIFDNRFTLQFTPDGALGTNGDSLETVSIYPNPTQNLVTIVSTQTIVTSATVYDIRGRVVFEVDFSNQTIYQIDLSAMEAAVYFVEIATESGTVNKRVIKRD